MADEDQGASPRELLVEACRRDNTDLLSQLFTDTLKDDEQQIADLINTARDPTGLTALLVAAKYGSYDALDMLLDQPMVETDPAARSTLNTPLHEAVEYANSRDESAWPTALAIVDILLDAGCDPRLRNKSGSKPVDTVDGRNTQLREALRKGEMALNAGGDVVDEDAADDEDRDDGHNSASDDDG